MLKHQHNEFPSDVCTLLQAGSAVIKVYDVTSDSYSTHTVYGSNGIMNVNMDKKVMTLRFKYVTPKEPSNFPNLKRHVSESLLFEMCETKFYTYCTNNKM